MTPGDVSSYWTGRALDFITAHPGSWLRLMARKLLLLLNAREMLDTESQESYAEWSWPLRIGGWFGNFGVLVPLALLGMLVAWREKRTGILYALTGTYAASVLMFYVFARYRLPLVPLFMLFAADGVAWFLDWLASAKQPDTDAPGSGIHLTPKIAVAALAVLGCAVVANWPLLSGPLMIAITETNLAVQLQADGRATDAAAHYERAIAIQPDYAPAYNNLGVARRAAGDLPGALAALRQAVSLRPDYPDAHYNLANALLSANQPEEAARHFRIALQSIPDSAGVSNNLGIALAAEGRAGVAVDPTSAKAHRNLADALASAGHTAEAVAEFERARTLDPNDPATRYNFGSTLLEAGRLEEAVAEFRAAVRLTPESPEAHNNLGIALGSLGDVDGAIEEFRRALALRPGFADAERNLATARAQRAPGGGRP
jgi:tetratricopeptide (TPR) repeat protein